MTHFLFVQKFIGGALSGIALESVQDLFSRFGILGKGRGDLEVAFEADKIAGTCTLVQNEKNEITCIGFERPKYDDLLRQLVWECIERFGCVAFDDALVTIYRGGSAGAVLPPAMVSACVLGVRRVSNAQQLWPKGLESQVSGAALPALRYTNANPNGANFQMFDGGDPATKELIIEFLLKPEACNPGTLRVIRNLEARVDLALSINTGYSVSYRYHYCESSLLALEAASVVRLAGKALIVSPPFGAPVPPHNFVADREVFASIQAQVRAFIAFLAVNHSTVPERAGIVGEISRILDYQHKQYLQAHTLSSTAPSSWLGRFLADNLKTPPQSRQKTAQEDALRWAIQAGCFLGNYIWQTSGGQWGYITRGGCRIIVLKSQDGHLSSPSLQVLDHLINGTSDSVSSWFLQLQKQHAPTTPRAEDTCADVFQYCQILRNGSTRIVDGLPLEEQIPRQQLDFTLHSLISLDTYLAKVVSVRAQCKPSSLHNLAMVAGAYLGEVIRSSANSINAWQWINYNEYLLINPDFSQEYPREPFFFALLLSAEHALSPCAFTTMLLEGNLQVNSFTYAINFLGLDMRVLGDDY